jgi:hypothetical protein
MLGTCPLVNVPDGLVKNKGAHAPLFGPKIKLTGVRQVLKSSDLIDLDVSLLSNFAPFVDL